MKARKRSISAAVILIGLCFFAVLIAGMAGLRSASANEASDILYHYFENSSAIAADGNDVYLADGQKVYVYSVQNGTLGSDPLFTAQNDIKEIAVAGRVSMGGWAFVIEGDTHVLAAYTLSGDTLTRHELGGGTNAPLNGYSHVAVHMGAGSSGQVYAAHGNEVHIFSLPSRAWHAVVEISGANPDAGGIVALTAGPREVFIVYYSAQNLTVARLLTDNSLSAATLTIGAHAFTGMIYLSGENEVAIWLDDRIQIYNADPLSFRFEIDRPRIAGTSIVHIAAGSAYYFTFNRNFSVSRFTPVFSEGRVIIASRSSEWGFYDTPVDVASRLGRVFVADHLNNRVSVKRGNEFYAINLVRPISVAADTSGYLYAAYHDSRNRIDKYDISPGFEIPINQYIFAPYPNAVISLLRADSFDNLYVLTAAREVYFLAAGSNEFVPLDTNGLNVYGIAAGLNRPGFYLAAAASDTDDKAILRVTYTEDGVPMGTESAGFAVEGFIDFSVDADGALYFLVNRADVYYIIRYDLIQGVYVEDVNHVYDFSHHFPGRLEPVRISVSAIDDTAILSEGGASVVRYRDILIADAGRHTVRWLSCNFFGIDYTSSLPPVLTDSPEVTFDTRIIRTLLSDAPLFATGADVFPIRRVPNNATSAQNVVLPQGFSVIVINFSAESDYSMVIADNTAFDNGGAENRSILTGYIRNRYLSEPLEYFEPDEISCVVAFDAGADIFKYPSLQAPVYTPIGKLAKETPLTFLNFVRTVVPEEDEEEDAPLRYGYTDNRSTVWYRVRFTFQGAPYEGYVSADLVAPPGALLGGTVHRNAKIIVNPAFRNLTYAPVFEKDANGEIIPLYRKDAYGTVLLDENNQPIIETMFNDSLVIGTKVQVVETPFNSAVPYTLIRFTHAGGAFEFYVRTANLEFDGFDIKQVIAVAIIVLTLILTGGVVARYVKIRKHLHPKEEAVFAA